MASITLAAVTNIFNVSLNILDNSKKRGWQSAPPTINGRGSDRCNVVVTPLSKGRIVETNYNLPDHPPLDQATGKLLSHSGHWLPCIVGRRSGSNFQFFIGIFMKNEEIIPINEGLIRAAGFLDSYPKSLEQEMPRNLLNLSALQQMLRAYYFVIMLRLLKCMKLIRRYK